METRTRYDLNAAIENWRAELAAQPALTADNRHELETHLRDAIAGFQQRGLNDEESFWLACKRVGKPQKLNEEFVKSAFIKAWRERVFWMANALLLFSLWGNLASVFWLRSSSGNTRPYLPWRLENSLPDWILFYLPHWLREFPNISLLPLYNVVPSMAFIALCIIFVSSNRLQKSAGFFCFIFQSRSRFIAFAMLTVSAITLASVLVVSNNLNDFTKMPIISQLLAYHVLWNFSLIGLIAWLMPSQKSKDSKTRLSRTCGNLFGGAHAPRVPPTTPSSLARAQRLHS
ncbi:MAG: hypothetical protein WDN00_16625 [Limisphaerales bacterium]